MGAEVVGAAMWGHVGVGAEFVKGGCEGAVGFEEGKGLEFGFEIQGFGGV